MNWQAVEALATVAAAWLAYTAWRTSQETLGISYRPVVRPVPTNNANLVKLKNIGNGPAMAVMIVNATHPEEVIGEVPTVERLGERGETGEANRVGNVGLILDGLDVYAVDNRYRLFYQDIANAWHETTFEITSSGFKIRHHGPKHWWHFRAQIPNAVKARGHFAGSDELV